MDISICFGQINAREVFNYINVFYIKCPSLLETWNLIALSSGLKTQIYEKLSCLYSKEAYLKHNRNAANKKEIGVHTTEKTSKTYPNKGTCTI